MPTNHLVYIGNNSNRIPVGISSITIQYKMTESASTWLNYTPGVEQRLAPGCIVKFTVSLFATFILSSQKVFYADEYDDTTYLALSSGGENAWTFVMPNADAYIECVAESGGSASGQYYDGIVFDWNANPNARVTFSFYTDGVEAALDRFLSGNPYFVAMSSQDRATILEQYRDFSPENTVFCFTITARYSENRTLFACDAFPVGTTRVLEKNTRFTEKYVLLDVVGIQYVGGYPVWNYPTESHYITSYSITRNIPQYGRVIETPLYDPTREDRATSSSMSTWVISNSSSPIDSYPLDAPSFLPSTYEIYLNGYASIFEICNKFCEHLGYTGASVLARRVQEFLTAQNEDYITRIACEIPQEGDSLQHIFVRTSRTAIKEPPVGWFEAEKFDTSVYGWVAYRLNPWNTPGKTGGIRFSRHLTSMPDMAFTLESASTSNTAMFITMVDYTAIRTTTNILTHVCVFPTVTGKTTNKFYMSVQYYMSPENTGSFYSTVTELEVGTESFSFQWRIKVGYELKGITTFAVGSGASETSIPNNYTYDGDTRTYTVTVSGIISGATGVRVFVNAILVTDPSDSGGTNNTPGSIGGDGTYDDTSDEVPLPGMPTGISAADSGFVTLFRPTVSQLKNLGNYLWSHLDDFWENLQKIFTNPMDYIIGLNIFPVSPAVGTSREIYIGNWLTNISMPPVNNQFYEFDCGIRNIDKYFGSFLDYGPNTSARIMLPFIGDRDLSINEIMGKTLHLWYRINLLSGECLAALTINNSVYYQWNGNCAIPVPVTGSDWSRLYGGIGRMVGAGVGFAMGGLIGMGIGGALGTMTTAGSNVNYVPFTGVDNQTHYQRVGPRTPYDRASQLAPDPIREPPREEFGLSLPAKAALAASTAHIVGQNIMGATPRVAHSGDMSGGMSIMGNRTPYIVLEYPNVDLPDNYKHLYGYPSNQYVVLGSLSGYTECKAVMFESTTATDDEVELIIRTLKSGVYL